MNILYKEGSDRKSVTLSEETIKDIALDELIGYMSSYQEERDILRKIMTVIPSDPSDMLFRQEILRDLLDDEALCGSLSEVLDLIKTLGYYGGARKTITEKDITLYSLLEVMRELSVYVNATEKLEEILKNSNIRSEGLISLRDQLSKIVENENFSIAKEDIKQMHEDLSNVRAAIVGVNFNPDLSISEVSAIEFVDYPIRSKYTLAQIAVTVKMSTPFKKYQVTDPLIAAITPHMEKHLKRHFADIRKNMSKYVDYDSRFLTEMHDALVFYLRSAVFGRRLQAKGYEYSFPQIKDGADTRLSAEGFYNVRLAIAGEENIVKNDFSFTSGERLFILTGPNRGGKTILEQGLALISVMSSLGMFVTAHKCEGIPFRNILTHFPIDENLTINYGRLGEEAVRIKEIVASSDEDSLILFNETFSTTSAADALYLSLDLMHVLKDIGSYVIFNTHIHELADKIPEMNGWDGEGKVTSIVMEIRDNVNTFRLMRGAPDTGSYARNIAEKYGITYEQMKTQKES